MFCFEYTWFAAVVVKMHWSSDHRLFDSAGLVDEQQKVRTISALAIAALAEAATPYGIESFDSVLKPLWKGIRQHRGKVSRKFGKSIHSIERKISTQH